VKRSTLLYLVTAAICIAIGLLVGLRTKAPDITPTAQAAPALQQLLAETLPNAAGKLEPLSQWHGQILVINFWATWCAPCVNEMPALSSLQTELRGKKIQIIGIGIDSAKNIAEFADKYPISYPLYVSGMAGSKFSRAFGNQAGGLPFTVVVGSDGQIRKTYLGQLDIAVLRSDLLAL
jgi:thiol-disulfide isomerase/thioredoxin